MQRAFQSLLLHGTRQIEPLVAPGGAVPLPTRLGIYEHAFTARLSDALMVTYPALRIILGHNGLTALARAFTATSPPAHFSIRYFGDTLSEFIATAFHGPKARVLGELAHWEWTLAEVFDAPDSTPLTSDDFASVEAARWGTLCFLLSPSLRTVVQRSNAFQWWRAASEGCRRPRTWRSAKPAHWALWRSQLTTHYRKLSDEEAWALGAVAAGESFASICAGLRAAPRQEARPIRAARLLQRWVLAGWIVGFETSSTLQGACER